MKFKSKLLFAVGAFSLLTLFVDFLCMIIMAIVAHSMGAPLFYGFNVGSIVFLLGLLIMTLGGFFRSDVTILIGDIACALTYLYYTGRYIILSFRAGLAGTANVIVTNAVILFAFLTIALVLIIKMIKKNTVTKSISIILAFISGCGMTILLITSLVQYASYLQYNPAMAMIQIVDAIAIDMFVIIVTYIVACSIPTTKKMNAFIEAHTPAAEPAAPVAEPVAPLAEPVAAEVKEEPAAEATPVEEPVASSNATETEDKVEE